MPVTLGYLVESESTVIVELPRFHYRAASLDDHVAYHHTVINRILKTHRSFSVACDASTFSVWHAAAIPLLVRLAREARARYKNKLDAVMILDAPLLLRSTYRAAIAPFVPPATAEKISFVSTPQKKND